MSSCDARIRPFPNPTEIRCEQEDGHDGLHVGVLRDYAYEGSETTIDWEDGDRRTFYGEYPGPCTKTDGCVLPAGHPRDCAR